MQFRTWTQQEAQFCHFFCGFTRLRPSTALGLLEYVRGYVKENLGNVYKENKVLNIIAFVTLKDNINKSELQIKKDLQKKIPEYMCPKIKIVNNFPLNKNGKCDEKKLLEEF